MILEVYDLECLSNLFTYTGYCPKEDKYYQFVICNWRNEIEELYNHLNRGNIIQVGFNNISYDYPLEHHFLNHYCEYKNLSGTLMYLGDSVYVCGGQTLDLYTNSFTFSALLTDYTEK